MMTTGEACKINTERESSQVRQESKKKKTRGRSGQRRGGAGGPKGGGPKKFNLQRRVGFSERNKQPKIRERHQQPQGKKKGKRGEIGASVMSENRHKKATHGRRKRPKSLEDPSSSTGKGEKTNPSLLQLPRPRKRHRKGKGGGAEIRKIKRYLLRSGMGHFGNCGGEGIAWARGGFV